MPIDPNIALSVKPVQLANPLEQYMQVQQIQGAQNQSRLADLMYGEKQRDLAADKVQADAMAGAQDVGDALAKAGYGARALAYRKTKLDADAKQADIGKTGAETHAKEVEAAHKAVDIAGQAFGYVRANPTLDNALAAIDYLGSQPGLYKPELLEAWRQQVRSDPSKIQSLADQAFRASLAAKDQLPKIDTRNLGGTTQTIGTDPLTGKTVVLNSAKNTQSPDNAATVAATIRGQDMTDARARDTLDAGRNQVVQSDNGPVLVNTRTGAGKTIMGPDGQPLPGVTKPLNDSQSKALLFGTRMQEADKILGQLATEGTTTSIPGARAPLVGGVISALSSDNRQMLDQAKRDFINATLRRESGAAISAGEFENGEKQYFPQIGEGEKVITQKARNRQLAIKGILAEVPEKQRGSITPAAAPTALPPKNAKGWVLHVDAGGNRAYVSPDGKQYEEVH